MDETARKKMWADYARTRAADIREKIILEYAPLVKVVAGRLSMYLGYNVEYEDLVSYGIFGLIDAIDKFDSMKEVKFETYASLRIRGAILDQIRKMDWIPRTIRQKQKKIDAVIRTTVLKDFTDGNIGQIYLAYTHFKNTVVHIPTLMKLLPVEFTEAEIDAADKNLIMNYEPNEREALDMIIPKYVTSIFYGALVEAVASENGARMQAMDSATSNAEDMISDLSLKYNRARQGSITQELTEIIAGAEAIS